MLRKIVISALFFLLLCCDLFAESNSKPGVVLLHGKWGSPSQHIDQLALALKREGFMVLTPLMPWSKERGYDVDYPAALEIVDNQVRELRKRGAQMVILAGHSMGANAAVAYAANGHEKIDGVIAIAPGHTPDLLGYHLNIESSFNKASAMIREGKGNERASFIDVNGGRTLSFDMTAATYFSYNDNSGMAVMPLSASKVTQRIPLFWILGGTGDVLYKFGKGYLFEKWPMHPLNKYLVLNSTHLKAPDDAKDEILQWINTVNHSPSNR
jgi:pimeloyl-ACP methyl ester carboxylesterase